MKPMAILLFMSLWAGASTAGAIGNETPPADSAKDKPVATEAAAQKEAKEFKPPPGFVTKKHGKFVLYCKREATIGTRFKTEKCYDEQQMRDYMIALEENKVDIDRIRNICSNPCVCGKPC